MRFVVEPMRVEQIPAVSAIERQCFTTPWPSHAYRKELQDNRLAHYFVARRVDQPPSTSLPANGHPQPAQALTPGSAPSSGLLSRLARLWRPLAPDQPSPDLQADLESIVGYAGLWLMVDEAHITTIAVSPRYQGQGVGELLLLALIDCAIALNARWLTLEVRVSNVIAQSLYRKYTFREMGVRKRYYSDDGEDALVMWTEPLDSPTFTEVVARNRAAHAARMQALSAER